MYIKYGKIWKFQAESLIHSNLALSILLPRDAGGKRLGRNKVSVKDKP